MAELDIPKKKNRVGEEVVPIEEEVIPNPPEEQKPPQPVPLNNEATSQNAANNRNLFKRLQSIREFNKFKLELKHQSTLKKQDTMNYMRQSSSGRAARVAPEEKIQMQSLIRRTMNQKKKFLMKKKK